MLRYISWGVAMVWACVFGFSQNAAAQSLSDCVSEFLRHRIETANAVTPKITVGNEPVYASIMLPKFYQRRIYRPAWSDDKGPLAQVDALIKAIRQADQEGLRSVDYHLEKIEVLMDEVRENQRKRNPLNPQRLVDLELLLTDAFLIYGSHLLAGRINPQTIDSEWFANRREADLAEVLQKAIDANQIDEALISLMPSHPGYARLRDAFARRIEIDASGDWPTIPGGPKLKKGDKNKRIAAVRKKLMAVGDLIGNTSGDEDIFDESLEEAVRRYQKRHGLDADGVIGAATLAAINIPVSERIKQMKVNLERWRWLPKSLGKRYILVNIADFSLEVMENSRLVLDMRVVVGKQYRRTPVFSDKMTYLVFCPYWHVPPSIAIQDKLPLILEDPSYLAKQNMKVFMGWGVEAQQIDPGTIKWLELSASYFPYRLRQDPGPNNALGRVKFMFPNQFNVYLHDTPSRELFRKTMRTFSSGCIRIEKPVELAEYVLRGDPKWTGEHIQSTIDKWTEQTVRLPEPVPVHLLYWTAWADEDGTIQFRNDIYGRDKPLEEALREEPPGA